MEKRIKNSLFLNAIIVVAVTFVINLIIEMFNRCSVVEGILFMFKSPLKFLLTTLIIITVFSFGFIFKRRIFYWTISGSIFLILGLINRILQSVRVSPFNPSDIAVLDSAITLVNKYVNLIEMILIIIGIILVIWLYSHKSGIKTIIWTDWLQTILFLTALVLVVWQMSVRLNFNIGDTIAAIGNSSHSRIFVFDDWGSTQNFFKQFFSGMFITIVMTGLDQDQMQKNLTIRTLKDAQKNVVSYGFAFAPINFLFLSLGVLLIYFAEQNGIVLPEVSDNILPIIASEYLGPGVLGVFVVGIVAAAFSSADSALTALTTSFCVDILDMKAVSQTKEQGQKDVKIRGVVHIGVSVVFVLIILIIEAIGSDSIITAIYKLASYTYGPLLGLYGFGLYSKVKPRDRYVPYIAISAPVLCFIIEMFLKQHYNYQVGYELLLLNGLITGIGLWLISTRKKDILT